MPHSKTDMNLTWNPTSPSTSLASLLFTGYYKISREDMYWENSDKKGKGEHFVIAPQVVSSTTPELGCSPDGIALDANSIDIFLVEIKCPYTLRCAPREFGSKLPKYLQFLLDRNWSETQAKTASQVLLPSADADGSYAHSAVLLCCVVTTRVVVGNDKLWFRSLFGRNSENVAFPQNVLGARVLRNEGATKT